MLKALQSLGAESSLQFHPELPKFTEGQTIFRQLLLTSPNVNRSWERLAYRIKSKLHILLGKFSFMTWTDLPFLILSNHSVSCASLNFPSLKLPPPFFLCALLLPFVLPGMSSPFFPGELLIILKTSSNIITSLQPLPLSPLSPTAQWS